MQFAERMVALFLMQGGPRGTPGWSLKHLEGIQETHCFGDHRELTYPQAVCPCTKMAKKDVGKKLKPSVADSSVAFDSMATGSPIQGCGAEQGIL